MGMAKYQHKNKIVNDEMEAHSLGIYHRQLNIKFPFSIRPCQRWQMDLSKDWNFICVHIPQIRSVISVFRCWADSFRSVLPFPTPSWNINNPRTCVQFSQPHLEPPTDPARTARSSVYCSMYGCGCLRLLCGGRESLSWLSCHWQARRRDAGTHYRGWWKSNSDKWSNVCYSLFDSRAIRGNRRFSAIIWRIQLFWCEAF